MFFTYLVKNSVCGAYMETSTEIGLETANLICKKYGNFNARKPIYKKKIYINKFLYPLVKFDSFLYQFNCPSLTQYIPPLILLFIYIVLIILIILHICVAGYKNKDYLFQTIHKCKKSIVKC